MTLIQYPVHLPTLRDDLLFGMAARSGASKYAENMQMRGPRFQFFPNGFTVCSSDGFRIHKVVVGSVSEDEAPLATRTLQGSPWTMRESAEFPSETTRLLKYLKKIGNKSGDGVVVFDPHDEEVVFPTHAKGELTLRTSPCEHEVFPDAERVTPKNPAVLCQFGADTLLAVLVKLEPARGEKPSYKFEYGYATWVRTRIIGINFDLHVGLVRDGEIEECESCPAQWRELGVALELDLDFNGYYLADALKGMSGRVVEMLQTVGYPNTAVVLRTGNRTAVLNPFRR